VSFTLGINFPWVTCGHDFGPRPPEWSGAPPTDWAAVEAELSEMRALGLRMARWWVLAGGVNLPVGAPASSIARRAPFVAPWPRWQRPRVRWRRGRPEHWRPRAPLPALPRRFLDDFERLLRACASAGVKLVPSLVSFELFLPLEAQGGPTSGGRAAFALGARQAAFFDATLEPLLEVTERHRDALAAWEVANEPGWALAPGRRRDGAHPPWVRADALTDFLLDGVRRIARRDLRATIGFDDPRPRWLDPAARTALRRLAERGAYVHQRHHYPRGARGQPLPPAAESPVRPCWLGELATARAGRWSDAGLAEDDPDAYLERRLALVRERGYEAALLWASRATDPSVRWDAGTRAQVRRAAGLAADAPLRRGARMC
jgi:hypothetical protein